MPGLPSSPISPSPLLTSSLISSGYLGTNENFASAHCSRTEGGCSGVGKGFEGGGRGESGGGGLTNLVDVDTLP